MSRKPDIEVQRGVYVLIGVNELGTQSRVSVYIIYGIIVARLVASVLTQQQFSVRVQ